MPPKAVVYLYNYPSDYWNNQGGWGVHPRFFVKLVFEIANDQQTRTHDQTFEVSRTPPAHQCPRCSHAHSWSIFGAIMQNNLNTPKTEIMGALLVASGLRNSYPNFYPDWKKWMSYEPKTIFPYLGIRTNFYRFWSNINI